MERAKSDMYEQAGRNRGWSTVNTASREVSAVPQPAAVMPMPEPMPTPVPIPMPEPMPTPAPMPMPEPTMPMPMPMFESVQIPEPPVVVEVPEFMQPQEDCQTIAMAFVEMQKWQGLYEPERGFSCGTIFAELDLPWLGKGACKDE